MKKFVLAAYLLCAFAAHAFDPEKDLAAATVIGSGPCQFGTQVFMCASAEVDTKKYIVVFDRLGFAAVFSVAEFKQEYKPGDMTLVWKRGDKQA